MNKIEIAYAKIIKSGNFPSLPEVLIKLLDACEDEERPLAEIADIISKDPVLSFKVLQLVNSAYYGLRQTFTSVEQAVVYLGANSIKNIAVTTAISQVFEFKRLKRVKRFDLKEFWWHSLLCGTLAKRVAQISGYSNSDEAYLSGLLHDIGKIVLVSTFPEEHDAILSKTDNHENTLWAEQQLIGVNHCQVGAWLIRKWQLASIMADAIRYHHHPIEKVAESFPLIKIVYFANLLTQPQQAGTADEVGDVLFGFAQNELSDLYSGAIEEVEEVARSLNIKIKPPEREIPGKDEVLNQQSSTAGGSKSQQPSESTAKSFDDEEELGADKKLQLRIRNLSLVTSFLEQLSIAEDNGKILEVFEQCVTILFGRGKILFFFPDEKETLFKAAASNSNPYRQASRDLVMPLKRNSSQIIKIFYAMVVGEMTKDGDTLSLADNQILTALNISKALIVPLKAGNRPIGVALLEDQEDGDSKFGKNELKLLNIISQQVGLCLYVERMKQEKAKEIESERMAAISMTAKKFAHEINNPLGIISNYLVSLKLKLAEEINIQEDLEVINEEIRRISSLINQLDFFSQPMSGEIGEIDIDHELKKIIHLIKVSKINKSDIVVSYKPKGSLPFITTSRDGFRQIVINLLKNSMEALHEGGEIEVSSWAVVKESPDKQITGVVVSISDNGPGLPENIKQNLYKPFVTTKKDNHAGLGLSIVSKTVQALGGRITCVSKEKRGTTFKFFLPLQIKQT
ncbi:MAG: HDOD domain-containing protein [Desulfopila sp.]|jgi:putative nucleotidyltransferase with HDIG domain|nr:HDOD domain-containing protein [Desulfopila sp.]